MHFSHSTFYICVTGNANGEEDGDINKVMKQLEQQGLDDQDKEEDGEDGLFFLCVCVTLSS